MNTAAESRLIIREPASTDELHAVEAVQKEVWGIPDIEVVNLHHLIAVQASGGVLLCAFDGEKMAAFVYGFVGHERGKTVHHSHMLAVRSEYRSRNVGYRLKLEQRRRVLDQGIKIMTWTFDPLQSLNAFFNFAKLGVIADRYYPNFYGTEAASFLHQNGTDRLWVSWHLDSNRVGKALEGLRSKTDAKDLPAMIVVSEKDTPTMLDSREALTNDRFVIEIPGDIGAIGKSDTDAAREWRRVTREAFVTAIDAGFVVEDFVKIYKHGRQTGAYVLGKSDDLKLW